MSERLSPETGLRPPEVLRRLDRVAQAFRAPPDGSSAPAKDPLGLALADIAQHYGRRVTPAAMVHGLPLVNGRLAAEHVALAAARAGLDCEPVQRDAAGLQDAELPIISVIKDGSVDIVWQIGRDAAGRPVDALVSEPGLSAMRTRLPFAEFAAAQSGRIITARPGPGGGRHAVAALPPSKSSWLFGAFAASRKAYGEAILATLAINVLALAMPLFTMNVYDRVLPNAAVETLWALSIGVIVATGFDLLIKTLRGRFVDAAARRADVTLGNFIFARLIGARLASGGSTGVRANTLREYETLREFFNSATLTAFGDLPFLVLFLAMIAVVAGPLVLVPLAAMPLVLGIGWWTQRRIARLTEQQFRDSAQKSGVAVEAIAGLESIKAAAAESWMAARWERALADGIRTGHAMREASAVGMNIVFAAQTLTQVMMIIAGFYMVASGSLTTGALIAATMLAGRALQPLGQMAGLLARAHQVRIAYRVLDDIVMAPQERPDDAISLEPEHFEGAIAFDAVSLAYEKDAPAVLREVSFSIAPGEKVAIVGSIGSGKTTALKLIQGLVAPSSGRVLVDGLPVGQIEPALLRGAVGYALHDAEIFQGTLRENIAMGNAGMTDAQLVRAARMATAFDWIGKLPKGLDTPVRERGAGLSSGQRQSLTLARALAREPRVLLLDEPTSAMDPTTELQAVHRLKAGLADRTLVVVTHRPAILELVDRIIVLDGGRKILDGPKGAVLVSMRAMAERAQAQVQTQVLKADVQSGALA